MLKKTLAALALGSALLGVGQAMAADYVIDKKGHPILLKKIGVTLGGHPLPDGDCVLGSKKILEFAEDLTEHDLKILDQKVGRKLDVAAAHSTSYRGSLLAIDQRSITLRREGASVLIPAADVLRVRYAGVRARHVRYGMAIGAVVGAVAMWAIDSQSGHPEPGSALGLGALFLGLPGGALAGAVIPIGPPLYQAPATAAAP